MDAVGFPEFGLGISLISMMTDALLAGTLGGAVGDCEATWLRI